MPSASISKVNEDDFLSNFLKGRFADNTHGYSLMADKAGENGMSEYVDYLNSYDREARGAGSSKGTDRVDIRCVMLEKTLVLKV